MHSLRHGRAVRDCRAYALVVVVHLLDLPVNHPKGSGKLRPKNAPDRYIWWKLESFGFYTLCQGEKLGRVLPDPCVPLSHLTVSGLAVSALSLLVTHCLRRLLRTGGAGDERQQFLGRAEVRSLA